MVLAVSEDRGRTFPPDRQLVVYEHDTASVPGLGVVGKVPTDDRNDDADAPWAGTWTFGHPVAVVLGEQPEAEPPTATLLRRRFGVGCGESAAAGGPEQSAVYSRSVVAL